jgi:hypothetical protein
MMKNPQWIPCQNQLKPEHRFGASMWFPSLTVERLMVKSNQIKQLLHKNGFDWAETFYQHMASSFGFKVNNVAFELLAKSVPLRILLRHVHDHRRLEAIMYGQAGLLIKNTNEPYPEMLHHEYEILKAKYQLQPLTPGLWKFLRLRPQNFPTIRISQFCSLISKYRGDLFSLTLIENSQDFDNALHLQASEYWHDHYNFKVAGKPAAKFLGGESVNSLIINGILPFMFCHGFYNGKPEMREKSLLLLEQRPAENNSLVSKWGQMGMHADNALESQALIQLKKVYCDYKRCLECRIGKEVLTS